MRLLLKAWLVIIVGILIGVLIKRDTGYVVVVYEQYNVEMTLTLFFIFITLLFSTLYFSIRLWIYTYHVPKNVCEWYQEYKKKKSQNNLTYGLLDLAEGRWKKAEKKLLHSVSDNRTSLLNYLGAAKAAQQQGDRERRDNYIRLAYTQIPSMDIAVGLTQAELQLADQKLEQALATLQHLHEVAPKHTYILRTLYQLYEKLAEWEQLIKLLPEIKKYNILNSHELEKTEIMARRHLMKKIACTRSTDELINEWEKQPYTLKNNQDLFKDYIGHLKYKKMDEKAEKLLYKKLDENWYPELSEVYKKLNINKPGKHLKKLEKYLARYSEDAILLFLLGQLSIQAELWGKADDYLKRCIRQLNPPIEAYSELGRLSEYKGELENAVIYYRKALFPDNEKRIALH